MTHMLGDISTKTLVMLVGPSAVGKSTLMNSVIMQYPDFGRVSGFTTRAARSNDEPGLYRYVGEQEARAIIASDNIVQYAVHPTTGAIYGTQAVDYPKRFNLLDTLSTVVDELRQLPFKEVLTISITADPDSWTNWLLARYPQASQERTNRLNEAITSIEWSISQKANHHWIINQPGNEQEAARQIATHCLGSDRAAASVPHQAEKMLNQARILLSYK